MKEVYELKYFDSNKEVKKAVFSNKFHAYLYAETHEFEIISIVQIF